MIKRILLLQCLVLVIVVGFGTWLKITSPKVAIVRSALVVEGYEGMKEARSEYQHTLQGWQAHLDSLDQRFNLAIRAYEQEKKKLSATENQSRQIALAHQRAELEKYQASLEQQAKTAEERMIQGSLNQINSYVEQLADQQGFNIVLGTTQSGNILYANDAVDITDEVLTGLNQHYKK
jgi:outer membrane protein